MSLKKELDKKADWIHKFVKKILRYLRINDEKNFISLTNIAMMLILWKIWLTPATTFQDITALCVAVLGYQGKRLINGKAV